MLPDLHTLTINLTHVLRGQMTILDRQPNIYTSTFPSEIVTCRVGGGSELQLFCKYAAGVHPNNAYGHRGGVAYEAAVYRHLLQPAQVSTPTLYGTYTDVSTGDCWPVLEYLGTYLRVHNTTRTPAPVMRLAARWIGQFHRVSEARLSHVPMSWLIRYDAGYYLGWVRRTSLFAEHLHQRFPWLRALGERSEEFMALLMTSPLTVSLSTSGPGGPRACLLTSSADCVLPAFTCLFAGWATGQPGPPIHDICTALRDCVPQANVWD